VADFQAKITEEGIDMTYPCLPPPEIYFALLGSMTEATVRYEIPSLFAKATLDVQRERLNHDCSLTQADKESAIERIASVIREYEAELYATATNNLETDGFIGNVTWPIRKGVASTDLFKKILILFALRYGEAEAKRIEAIYANSENDNWYVITAEYYRKNPNMAYSLHRLWLRAYPADEISPDKRRSNYSPDG
jgi:hypothetical protein